MPAKKFLPVEDKFTIADVGSTLLNDLAKGLYQPEAVIREYVQNAVDSHRQWRSEYGTEPGGPIQIEIRSDRISILDYGIGMSEQDIRKVKAIAVSDKGNSDAKLTGYKGVGIWAGLSYFERLELYSTKRNEKLGFKLTIQFKNIVDAISELASIGDVLNGKNQDGKSNPNYFIEKCDADEDEHYAEVTLVSPTTSSEWFLSEEKIRNAIQRICPCEIDPHFSKSTELRNWYKKAQIELFPVTIAGKSVYRSYADNIEEISNGMITINDTTVAKYWLAIHENNAVLPESDTQLKGVRIIRNGFALGPANPYSNDKLEPFEALSQSAAKYLNWHIGEIHVINENLRPNLARDKFEESEATNQFIRRLREWYTELETNARTTAKIRSFLNEVFPHFEKQLNDFLTKSTSSDLGDGDISNLDSIRKELSKYEDFSKPARKAAKAHSEPLIDRLDLARAKYKQLVASINKITKTTSAQSSSVKSPSPTAEQPLTSIGTKFNSPNMTKQKSMPKSTSTKSNSDVQGQLFNIDIDDGGRVLNIEVVVSLLREILADNVPEKADLIIDKLRKRIDSLVD